MWTRGRRRRYNGHRWRRTDAETAAVRERRRWWGPRITGGVRVCARRTVVDEARWRTGGGDGSVGGAPQHLRRGAACRWRGRGVMAEERGWG